MAIMVPHRVPHIYAKSFSRIIFKKTLAERAKRPVEYGLVQQL
jgi:hypothetical protein